MESLGKWLIILGLVVTAVGLAVLFFSKVPFIGNYIGKLPGDIYIKRDNFTFYFPLTTSIIISIVISLILYLFRK